MRDLTRANAKRPAWVELIDAGYRVFTPLVWKVRRQGGRKERVQVPVIHDLLFVESTRALLDPFVSRKPTLQYRYVRGGAYCEAMTVPDTDMERFIRAVSSCDDPQIFARRNVRQPAFCQGLAQAAPDRGASRDAHLRS